MAALLLSKCAQFREKEEFIDVRLKVGEHVFPAHRNVLAANSDYFYAMFTDGMRESNKEVIELKDENISAAAVKIVMDSIYSGDVLVDTENVFEVLTTANHLQITSVVRQCCDCLDKKFIQRRSLDVQTYRQLSAFADLQGLGDLQEATQQKMASMYKEVCESEEFLTHIDADHLSSLLSRDDLSAPSETFVFKSVMQWIKYKKEERMSVAAKVIGAVRLGLVDIKDVIKELNTEEMQQVPEIQVLVCESLLHNNMPSPNSKFALEKTKPRSMSPVLVAVFPGRSQTNLDPLDVCKQQRPKAEDFVATQMKYFHAETKSWKEFPSMAKLVDATECFCAEVVGNYLYVAAIEKGTDCVIYRYNTVSNLWDKLPPIRHQINPIKCLCSVNEYIFAFSDSDLPQRYSVVQNHWQAGSKLPFLNNSDQQDKLIDVTAVIMNAKIYVLHGYYREESKIKGYSKSEAKAAVVHCFDPQKNEWKQIASTVYPHFGSSLFVDNNELYVAGGSTSVPRPQGELFCFQVQSGPPPVEVYNEVYNKWSVVAQKHIPPNNLRAVELRGGRVYFIIKKFPIDSGIRIPPEEVYQISFNEWENLRRIRKGAVLCHLTVKKDILKTSPIEAKSPAR